jgi:uncharacterized protein (TIGR03085 family)
VVTHSAAERQALSEALDAVGPDAPTLCEGWTARDMAAHVVVREGRPDATVGLIAPAGSFLSRRLDRIQSGIAAGDYAALVDRFRSGPPKLSPFALPGMDAATNLGEFFIHTEDVRRAQPGWEPRDLPAARQDALWKQVSGMGRMFLRKSPTAVEIRTPDGRQARVAPRKAGPDVVTLIGEPGELAMFLFGRQAHARVVLDGPAEAVATLRGMNLGL